MPSFKLDKSKNAKKQFVSGGAVLLALSIVIYILFVGIYGEIILLLSAALGLIGVIMLVAGLAADE